MTPDEAHYLAGQCAGTWKLGPDVHVWRKALKDSNFDGTTAWAVFEQMRDSIDRRDVTFAAFRDEYMKAAGKGRHQHTNCHRCDDGWVAGPPLPMPTRSNPDHAATSVKPCECDAGDHRTRQMERWRRQEHEHQEDRL